MATIAISVITAVAWLLVAVAGRDQWAALTFGVIPARLSGVPTLYPAFPAFLTPLSATLVHGGFLHLAFNLLMLVWCGMAVERILGRGATVLLYVLGAYASAAAQWLAAPHSVTPMIGASGAISAVIGAFALSFGQSRRFTANATLNRVLNAAWLLAAWVVLQLMVGWLAGGQGVLLATPAHIGGFIAGLLLQRPLLMWRYRSA